MVTVTSLREQAVELDSQIETLRLEMVQWLTTHTGVRMVNVMLWYDGQFKIMSPLPIKDEHLKAFLKEFGLHEKGHFAKFESTFHSKYEFIHWDFEDKKEGK